MSRTTQSTYLEVNDMADDNVIHQAAMLRPITNHPCMTTAQSLEWETWKAMAELINSTLKEAQEEVGLDFNNCPDLSKAIAAWGYRYLLLALEYKDDNDIDICHPPLFYSPLAEERIRNNYLQ